MSGGRGVELSTEAAWLNPARIEALGRERAAAPAIGDLFSEAAAA